MSKIMCADIKSFIKECFVVITASGRLSLFVSQIPLSSTKSSSYVLIVTLQHVWRHNLIRYLKMNLW